jgi:hypothetical protein
MVGLIVGVVVPVIQNVRFKEARTTTDNTLRQLVIATQNAHDTYKKFPPTYGKYPWTDPARGPITGGTFTPRTLYYHILPYLHGHALYDAGACLTNANGQATWGVFEVFLSPLDPQAGDGSDGAAPPNGVTSFLYNAYCFPNGPHYSRITGSFPYGTSNTIFFVTTTARSGDGWNYWFNNATNKHGPWYPPELGTPTDPISGVAPANGEPVRVMPGGSVPVPMALPANTNLATAQGWAVQLTPEGSYVAMGDAGTRKVAGSISWETWSRVVNPRHAIPDPDAEPWNQ